MKIYDVSAPIFEGMPVYKNKEEKQPKISTVTNGHVTESRVCLDVHSGTHIDAPLHMKNDGETIEAIAIERLIGPCKVFDVTDVTDGITKADIESFLIEKDDFVLFKTKNSLHDNFDFEFIYLKEEAARYLANKSIRGVGIDALGVERSQPGHPTHQALFNQNIIVIEGLRLKDVSEGTYTMIAAPLKLIGTDAAPARVLLMEK